MASINTSNVFYLIGIVAVIIGGVMFMPLLLELLVYKTHFWQPFALGAFIAIIFGSLLTLAFHSKEKLGLQVREAFLLTVLVWVISALITALPFYFIEPWNNQVLSFSDACFEAVSGLTTTGGTILKDLDNAPRGILLWRALLQAIGGLGIMVLAIAVLPILKIGGMELFRRESSDQSEKILSRLQQIAMEIFYTYFLLVFICTIGLTFAGMQLFEAICHALSTVSTGGFSTRDHSIAVFNNVAIEVVLIIFMILGGGNLILLTQALRGKTFLLFQDSQHRAYVLLLLSITVFLIIWHCIVEGCIIQDSIRYVGFTVSSFMTTTGFYNAHFNHWGIFSLVIFLIIGSVGGCTGSTAGGIKVFRLQVLQSLALSHLRHLRRPHGVYIASYGEKKIPNSVAISVFTFIFFYLFSLVLVTVILAALGLDLETSIASAISSLANIGAIFSSDNTLSTYTTFPTGVKWVLMVAMILGRLELLTVIAIFLPSFWRN